MKQVSKLTIFLLLLVTLWAMGCTGVNKYQVAFGITDWFYMERITLDSQYANGTPELQAWMRANINPHMNILQQMIIALGAIDRDDSVKVAACASEVLRIATGIKYDASRIVVAIKAKDYDTLLAETLALKTLIINRAAEKKIFLRK